MSNDLTVSNITSTSAVLNVTAVNDLGATARLWVLLREGNYSGNATALENITYSLRAVDLGNGSSIVAGGPNSTVNATGLKPNTVYSFQWSMGRTTTLSSSLIDRRRPLSPAGTFTTLPSAPVFTNISIVDGIVGSAYTGNVQASNTTSYTVASGSLPPGLSLNGSTGTISGTPTTAGDYTFSITATGAGGTANTGNLFIQIAADVVAPAWTDNTLSGDLRVGTAYSDGVAASGTSPTYSVSVGSLPTGLTINSSTGAVTGTPTAQGTFNFTLRAQNAAGNVTQAFTLVVKPTARRWDGSAFVRAATLKRWDGSAWVDVTQVRRWDGSNWIDANA